ncbi:uncharacterized protein LOC110465186 isoform X2 [Mizuhopecten yessoensis]|uniref:uncharacterized protein LOC110465186 isoform X2 n=1 Tax=Mizuhopecten yessoensis TaxID=6573 RepID=UPI000B458E91|nr:uncharacterized protein LOC110465186 isoform X2 [Mizuhopecten yessoensis]
MKVSKEPGQTWDRTYIFGSIIQIFTVISVVSVTDGQCPSKLKMHSFSCFGDYNTQFLNMQKSQRTLFSGVDVELLRAFCSAYMSAMSCINQLKAECGEDHHHVIDVPLINLNGATDELSFMCQNDDIYEVYARHMSCYMVHGSYSERCFHDVMNTTSRFLKRVNWKSLDDLCRDLSQVMQCIKDNIGRSCGQEAASLMDVLAKPMVRSSTMCDRHVFSTKVYSETYQRTTFVPPEGTNRRVISIRESDSYNGGGRTTLYPLILIICVVISLSTTRSKHLFYNERRI